ncbi:unnamed protein product [Prorocentrum cordatum]|uniref:Uncharacterized protein n=1 Tax=Prorocentrum cordatum TaxID=2364126 RepID=A0ABN9XPJ8_9DINO|nr:unnamed protein product [Polarella glacialis]
MARAATLEESIADLVLAELGIVDAADANPQSLAPALNPAASEREGSLLDRPEEQQRVARCCLACLRDSGGAVFAEVGDVTCSLLQELWSGLGVIAQLDVRLASSDRGGEPSAVCGVVVKQVWAPAEPAGTEASRDFASYLSGASFYEQGHAEALRRAGAACPRALLVERLGEGRRLNLCLRGGTRARPRGPAAGRRCARPCPGSRACTRCTGAPRAPTAPCARACSPGAASGTWAPGAGSCGARGGMASRGACAWPRRRWTCGCRRTRCRRSATETRRRLTRALRLRRVGSFLRLPVDRQGASFERRCLLHLLRSG